MPRKRLHHFNPRAYLKSFADDDGYLFCIKREPYEVIRLNLAVVAAERDFYTLTRSDGSPTDQLENELADRDAQIPRVVARACSDIDLTAADVDDLEQLYAMLIARGPIGRDFYIEEATSTKDRLEHDYAATFPNDDEATRAANVDHVLREVYGLPDHLSADPATVSRANVTRLADEIFDSMPKFVCVLTSDGWEFLTSDTPCSAFDSSAPPNASGRYGVDYESKTAELTLPLSRFNAALFTNHPMPRRVRCNDGAVRITDGRTVFFAKRMIFAHPSEDAEKIGLAVAQQITYRAAYLEPMLPAFGVTSSRSASSPVT